MYLNIKRSLDVEVSPVDIGFMRSGPNIPELARRLAGKWVALNPEDGSVAGKGETAKEAFEAAERAGIDLPVVFQVLADYGQLAPCLG